MREEPLPAAPADAPGTPPRLDPHHPFYGRMLAFARRLVRYHRMTLEGGPVPRGPCIYVCHHGAGYLVLDLVLSGYFLGWKEFHETGRIEDWRPLRIVAAISRIEKVLPGLPRAKELVGIVGIEEERCLAVLERGESLLVTPGGSREAQPSRDFYRLKWEGRYGFVRLALKTGVPIVPMAVVGGTDAYPGARWGKLSFWSPVPLPARLELALGEPIAVPRRPESARDLSVLKPLHALAWERTQALHDRLLARRRAR
ncbi:MAG TPA: 1-acyl-sn-glycerol-3-phosphate acyltransferase [Anaeromyxobacter sp.]|nr:1-acyl-sn-glycerol-3-phosphate acyltransferase [Anaeromyxobacter sp.]